MSKPTSETNMNHLQVNEVINSDDLLMGHNTNPVPQDESTDKSGYAYTPSTLQSMKHAGSS